MSSIVCRFAGDCFRGGTPEEVTVNVQLPKSSGPLRTFAMIELMIVSHIRRIGISDLGIRRGLRIRRNAIHYVSDPF